MCSSLRSTLPARRSPLGLLALGALTACSMLFGQPLMAQLTPNLAGTPDDGMICRTGYTGALSGATFKCSKAKVVTLNLECKAQFPRYVVRAVGASGTPDGRDLCTRSGISLGSTDPLAGLVAGTDYIKADVSSSAVTDAVAAEDAAEAAALGLGSNEVDADANGPVIALNATGSKDKANLTVRLYTFAIPTGNLISVRP
jgi:hypothetical protein